MKDIHILISKIHFNTFIQAYLNEVIINNPYSLTLNLKLSLYNTSPSNIKYILRRL